MKAILVISFGTSYHDTLEKTIAAAEREIAERFPEYEVRRAFTSGMIIRKLAERDGVFIDTVSIALDRLLADGCTEVICQPTHVINGAEYDKLCSAVKEYADRMTVKIGAPLLTSTDDYMKTARILGSIYGQEKTYILMGHGTDHHANSAYPSMDYCMRTLGFANIHVATVEGYPSLDDALSNIGADVKEITLAPFMFVAGDHAKNDLAGDDSDSWKSILASKGYTVRCDMTPLGERREIREIYISHIKEAIGR